MSEDGMGFGRERELVGAGGSEQERDRAVHQETCGGEARGGNQIHQPHTSKGGPDYHTRGTFEVQTPSARGAERGWGSGAAAALPWNDL
ncbi:hypothetical protein AAFF_G00158770 [Aldrovandia affinis]|uniref:Uncharacterized protein n=1 Tax=Aldrovandia affinis TaxID=143900 RepID=A0AAD7W8Y7_9TELE|nr:hypothetical protein AAFF_G00158770 [Aldrovandia affinis]